MEQQNKNSSEIEFNSMVAVLKRLDGITYGINESRQNRDLKSMLNFLVDYFKELAPDLTEPERKKIWGDIDKVKHFFNPLLNESIPKILKQLDEIDIELRILAKKHGFTTKSSDRSHSMLN